MAQAKRIVEEVLSWIIGGVFIYAGALKLLRPDMFLVDIQSYQLASYRLAYFASYYLPALEIVAGAGMLHRWFRRESAWLIFFLAVVFVCALAAAWIRGLDISCGCFGTAHAKANYPLLITRDVMIAASCLIVAGLALPAKPTKARREGMF